MDIQWLSQLLHHQSNPGRIASNLVLRPGDRLTATVLEVEKGNDALLSFGHLRAYARLPVPVTANQSIQVRVDETGQKLELVMTTGPESRFSNGKKNAMSIELFEPVSDKPSLNAHARMLVPGESLQGRITGFEKDGLQLVDFGKFKAFTKIDVPVRPGQVIGLTVTQSGDTLTLAINPSAKAGNQVPGQSAGAVSVARGDVSSLPASPMASTAQPPTAVADGAPIETVKADVPRMQTVEPPVRLPETLLPPTSDNMAAVRTFARQLLDRASASGAGTAGEPALATSLKTALLNLTQALDPASTAGGTEPLIHRVRAFVEDSGLYFEKKVEQAIRSIQSQEGRSAPLPAEELARHPVIRDIMIKDLKPNLLILKNFLESQDLASRETERHALETVKSFVQRAVSHLEQQQQMATGKPVDPDVMQAFSHLLLMTDTDKTARLKVYYPKKRQDGARKKPRVSLLLEMDRMGMVRTDLWMVGRDLNISFFVETDEIKMAIDKHQGRIGEMLENTFNTVAVNVVVNSAKIEDFDGEDLALPGQRLLDVRL
ncbi:MAG: hypothetical protein CR984_03955 [Proteobacteria bacterium]|nr:MAG: hypothetical protein CR984_03955 [Pseudomonadota bacterium]PIE66907.1 MAG: hypothetical protein CSA23_06725 [Deltaproteobacteria bacterium]